MTKLIIFDLDGVIFNSKSNMRKSWNEVRNKLNIKTTFNIYFNNIGLPFFKILEKLKIKKNLFLKAKKIFEKTSIKNFKLIKIYPGVKLTIDYLKKKKYRVAVLTSKNRLRTYKLLKKFNLKFEHVQCPTKQNLGKPNPKILNILNKKFNFDKRKIYYLGDTSVDYLFSKNSNINFIYCNYGYGKLLKKKVKSISKFKDLKKIF